MSIQPHRSKFKKSTVTYFKDNLLDIIDISETLSKNRYIHKCPLNNFIFSKYISQYKLSKENNKIKENNQDINNINNNEKDIIEFNYENINFDKLNQNKFHINFLSLKLQYENDYTVLFIDKYYPKEIIGEGSFGLVVNAIDIETKQKLAVKIIDKKNLNSKNDINIISFQVKLLKKLNNPRIMKIFNILETDKYIFIFMELIEGGNLKDLIINRYLDENTPYLFRDCECSLIMKGILESLKYLHKNNIIHRDIKPENILFKKKNDLSSVVLCDFGFAYQLKEYDKFLYDVCGTTIYMAPEIFLHRGYDFLVDSFSAGIVLFELCSGGMHPFFVEGMKKNEYIDKVININGKYFFSKEMPLLARNLFLKLCKYNPVLRYEAYKALKHPWITRSNTSQIPMTLIEEYNKSDKIVNFKALLATGIALIMIKNKYNMKPKIQESDSTFNESIYNKSNGKKIIKNKIKKIIDINNNFGNSIIKTNKKENYNIHKKSNKKKKPSIPLLKTSRVSKNLNRFIEKKISKKRLFPKIVTKSLKKYNSKEIFKEINDSKFEIKNKNEKEKRRLSLIILNNNNNNNNNNKKNKYINPHIFLRTYSCNRNMDKKDSNDIENKNISFFSNKKSRKINIKSNNKEIKLSEQIFKYNKININKEKNNKIVNYFLKNKKNNLILSSEENREKETPNLLSFNNNQRQETYINNINNIIQKKIKNIKIINTERNKKNNKRFFLKDVLSNI